MQLNFDRTLGGLSWSCSILLIVMLMQSGTSAQAQQNEDSQEQPVVQEEAGEEESGETPGPVEAELDLVAQVSAQLEEALARYRQGVVKDDRAQLPKIATRCEVLANSASDEPTRLALLSIRARALAALARLDTRSTGQLPGTDWLGQLRGVAKQIKAFDIDSAAAEGDYWLLLADLARIARMGGVIDDRQALAERLLTAYIARYEEDSEALEFVTDSRLSLAKLMDERGDQSAAARQLGAMGEMPEDSPRMQQTQPMRERIASIGRQVNFEAITTGLTRWRVADQSGNPILIHVYADPIPASVKMIDQIKTVISGRSLGGFSVVSLRVGDALPGSVAPPWPVIPVELEPGGLLDNLGIDALPTLIWLDQQGRLTSIGRTISVLDQQPTAPDPDKDEVEPRGEEQAPPDNKEEQSEPASPAEARDQTDDSSPDAIESE